MSQSISGNFPEIFEIVRVFFAPLKQFLEFLELFLH
jgi:transcriptional antiterminator